MGISISSWIGPAAAAAAGLMCAGCVGSGSSLAGGSGSSSSVHYLYAANRGTGDVSMFELLPDTGRPVLAGRIKAGSRPQCSLFTRDNCLFVGDAGDSDLWVYKVNASGAPMVLGRHSFEGPVTALCELETSTGFVVDALVGSKVHAFRVNSGGSGDVIREVAPSITVAPGDAIYTRSQGYPDADGYVLNRSAGIFAPFRQNPTALYHDEQTYASNKPLGVETLISPDNKFHVFVGGNLDANSSTPARIYLSSSVRGSYGPPARTLESDSNAVSHEGTAACMTTDSISSFFFADSAHGVILPFNANLQTLKIQAYSGTLAPTGSSPQCMAYEPGSLYLANQAGQVRHYSCSSSQAVQFLESVDGAGSDASSLSASDSFDPPSVTPLSVTASLPSLTVGTAAEQPLTFAGGWEGLIPQWSVAVGALPPGLSLTEDALGRWTIIGNPTTAGTYTFTLKAVEGALTAKKEYTAVVSSTSGGTGLYGRFFNMDLTPANASLTFALGGQSFGATSLGSISAAKPLGTGSFGYSLVNAAGSGVQTGSFTIAASLNRYVFYRTADRTAFKGYSSTYPFGGQAGISIIVAAPDASSLDVDLVQDSTGSTVAAHGGVASSIDLTAVPTAYHVVFRMPGSTAVYAATPSFTAAAGGTYIAAATAAAAGTGRRAFVQPL